MLAQVLGIIPVAPGHDVANSVMTPIFTEWWFRPVSNAARVGEHSAVVCMWLYRRPAFATRSVVGILTKPPNALGMPKPMSSTNTMTTFGAPAGAHNMGCVGAGAVLASN